MLNCYLIALSKGAACDGLTGDVSMHSMVLVARHLLSEFGQMWPYSMLFFLDSSEVGYKAEVRTLWVAHSPDAPSEPAEEPTFIDVTTTHMQLRRTTTRLPQAPGWYDLSIDWRLPGGKIWTRAAARYPVLFEER